MRQKLFSLARERKREGGWGGDVSRKDVSRGRIFFCRAREKEGRGEEGEKTFLLLTRACTCAREDEREIKEREVIGGEKISPPHARMHAYAIRRERERGDRRRGVEKLSSPHALMHAHARRRERDQGERGKRREEGRIFFRGKGGGEGRGGSEKEGGRRVFFRPLPLRMHTRMRKREGEQEE